LSRTRLTALSLLLLAALVLAVAGCSSDGAEQSTTSLSGTDSTTTLPDTLSATERELADNHRVQQQLAAYLTKDKAADDDPRMAILYGLQSRTQALSCLDALESSSLEVADGAMSDLNQAMNQAQKVADETVRKTLSDARMIIAPLGTPSETPGVAATLLEHFVTTLAPLLEEATQVMSVPTTVSSTTST
jgi:hypothetical protein